MATGDGSPTSGGTGDVIRTEDTATDTNTGVAGAKLGVSKIVIGRKGQDSGDASLDTPLDTHDARTAGVIRDGQEHIATMLAGIYQAVAQNGTVTRQLPGHAVTCTGITWSTTSVQVVQGRAGRKSVKVWNDSTSTGTLYLRLGAVAASNASGGYTVGVVVGSYYEVPATDVELGIQGIWAAGTNAGFCNVTEVD